MTTPSPIGNRFQFLFLKRGWINESAPLKNGVGRFVPQLMRLTLKFCKERPTSAGVREFIERDVINFAAATPHAALYLKPRRNRSPVVVAEYLNGQRHWYSFHGFSRDQCHEWLDHIRHSSGKEYQIQNKYEFSDHRSVQGTWNAFTFQDPALATATFPDLTLSTPRGSATTATEQLRRLAESQRRDGSTSAEEDDVLEATKRTASSPDVREL